MYEVIFNFQLKLTNNVYVFFKHLLTLLLTFVVLASRPIPKKQLVNRAKRIKMKIMVIKIVGTEITQL